MAQHSMWLNGKFVGDNVLNVEWECLQCHVRIPNREEAINHVRKLHKEGTIVPHLNQAGKRLAVLHFYQDASKRLAKILVDNTEAHFCKGLGAEPIHVSSTDMTQRTTHPIPDNQTLFKTVKNFTVKIRHKVEQKKGYISLTNSGVKGRLLRNEKEIQITLEEWFEPLCNYANIDMTREGETGRGLLDFKFSVGNDLKCLLEVKLFDSSKLQHGLNIQLPTYLQAEKALYGIYVPISMDPSTYGERLKSLKTRVAALNADYIFTIKIIDIRAWTPDSASVANELEDSRRYDPDDPS